MIKGCQVNIETSLREHPVFSALDITLFCKMLKNKRYLDVKGVVPIRLNPRGGRGGVTPGNSWWGCAAGLKKF